MTKQDFIEAVQNHRKDNSLSPEADAILGMALLSAITGEDNKDWQAIYNRLINNE